MAEGDAKVQAAVNESLWTKRAWGEPLAKLDRTWTKLEARLAAAVLIAEIAALCFWVTLRGLSSENTGGDHSGLVFRMLATSLVLGLVARLATRPLARGEVKDPPLRSAITTGAVVLGIFVAQAWVHVGIEYASNLLNWMQNASLLMLVGGLRGVATRLTLWLALLGASIATAKGKHINVDIVMRFLPAKARVPVAILGWLVGATVCTAAVWGFFDHIAIESFKVPAAAPCDDDASQTCETRPKRKVGLVLRAARNDLFLAERQISLDSKTIPAVLKGTSYNAFLTNAEWNTWMHAADWSAHFDDSDVATQYAPEDKPSEMHTPAIGVPSGNESARGLLVKYLNFLFPFGLAMIAIRFLLRSLLALAGYANVDPAAAHDDDDLKEAHEGSNVGGAS